MKNKSFDVCVYRIAKQQIIKAFKRLFIR